MKRRTFVASILSSLAAATGIRVHDAGSKPAEKSNGYFRATLGVPETGSRKHGR